MSLRNKNSRVIETELAATYSELARVAPRTRPFWYLILLAKSETFIEPVVLEKASLRAFLFLDPVPTPGAT